MTPLMELRLLQKYFPLEQGVVFSRTVGWVKAVDGVSFSVKEGETFGLVGESGCGKSTIAKLILLLERATAGSVFYRGKPVFELRGQDLSDYRAAVQAVFQDPTSSLNPRMRIRSIVTEPIVINEDHSRSDVNARLYEALQQVGLEMDAATRFPHEFSGGQRQRIALARSLTVRPRLIVLDEPVSALDVSIQAQMMNLLKELQGRLGVTYLFIAHNLATVRYMSHRIGVMYLGKLVEQGPGEDVYKYRLHPYTKALFSAALPSHPDSEKQKFELTGEVPSAFNVPSGCRFHPRCDYKISRCSEVEPDLKEQGSEHFVACHLIREQ